MEFPVALGRSGPLTGAVFAKKSNAGIGFTLFLTVAFWGGNNVGTKYLVRDWPPLFIGCTRLLGAGLILAAILRWTDWLGARSPHTPAIRRGLWWQGGLSLALYIFIFNSALQQTTAGHVALYLGIAPIWALLLEERPAWTRQSLRRYGAAGLAVLGVVVLCLPKWRTGELHWSGELLGVATGFFWTYYSRQCRKLAAGGLSGAEVSAETMCRAGLWLLPPTVLEAVRRGALVWRWDLVGIQVYGILVGGVICYALWNNGLRHWPTSRVFLFNNLIPLATMTWAWIFLGEPFTATFWVATGLIMSGVALGQARFVTQK